MRGLGRSLFLARSAKTSSPHLWAPQKLTKYSLFVSSSENGSGGIGSIGSGSNNNNNNNNGVYQHSGHFFGTSANNNNNNNNNVNRAKKEQESEDAGGTIKLHEYETDREGKTSQTNPGELPLTELVRDFVRPSVLFDQLKEFGHEFYCGVPDSLLKDFCAYVTDHVPNTRHIITPNEGNAISVGVGYHMATGKIPIIYLQNSGLGNAVNPLLSLSDRKVCQVPLLLMVGWRGEPGRKDEPQHMVQGKATTALLADMGIPFEILPDYEEGTIEALRSAHLHFQQRGSPYCLLVRKRTFTPYKLKNTATNNYPLSRQDALQLILEHTSPWDAVVATTGFTSRELYELRQKEKGLLAAEDPNHPELNECKDLLMVGSMGHASSIALGIAVNKPSRNILCLDGDGAMLMHMGILSTIGAIKPRNLRHILLNNAAHDSVGQQPTSAYITDMSAVAKSCGYTWCKSVSDADEIKAALKQMTSTDGPTFLEIRVHPGAKKDLGRPKESPLHNKKAFMEFLNK